MNKSYDFFLSADLSRYIGEWIAIIDREIVAHDKDVKKVYKKARKNYPRKHPLITKVPSKETMIL